MSALASVSFNSSLILLPGDGAAGTMTGDLEPILCLCGEGDWLLSLDEFEELLDLSDDR